VSGRSILRAVGKPLREAALLRHRLRYSEISAAEEQNRIFSEWGLSRPQGVAAVEHVLAAHPELAGSMQSEHYVLFGAISASRKPARILEIGTFDGRGTAMLAALFPAAQIDTLDLPDDHPMFKDSYKRRDDAVRHAFIHKRNELLAKFPNVNFQPMSSIALCTSARDPYDLIWVDGDHGYPTVTIDIVNGFRLLNRDGIILCDDVTKNTGSSRHGANSMYASIGAYQTLCALQDEGIAQFSLVSKRLSAKSNADPKRRKFIALAKHAKA
jgi:predicted O-methyltransferase YrrM